MNVFFQRFISLLLAVVLQRSFLDVLWPGLSAPAIILSVTITLIFLLGFEQGIGWVVLLLLLHMLLGVSGIFPVYAVAVAYGTSFIVRRLRIEHRIQSSLILALATGLSAGTFLVLLSVTQDIRLSASLLAANILEGFLVFPLVFGALRFREERIRSSLMSEFRGMRTS